MGYFETLTNFLRGGLTRPGELIEFRSAQRSYILCGARNRCIAARMARLIWPVTLTSASVTQLA